MLVSQYLHISEIDNMVALTAKVLLSIVTLHVSRVNGEYKVGFQESVLAYPQRLKELLPNGIQQEILEFYVPINALSQECLNDSITYLEGLKGFYPWAVKMLDASSKLPSGMMRGHLHDLGSFDGCLNINSEYPFTTQYCMVHFPGILPIAKYSQQNLTVVTGGMPLLYPELSLALCLPASCNLDDVLNHYTNAVAKFNATAVLDKYGCTIKGSQKMDSIDWIAVVILVILLSIVVVGTLCDLCDLHMEQPKNNESDQSLLTRMLISFSIIKNGRRILSTADPNRPLSFINGIRFISIAWIVAGHHYYMTSFFTPSLNMLDALEDVPSIKMAWIISGTISVDTFFVISGFLLSYIFLNHNKDVKKMKFNLPLYYLHRYVRLAPMLLITILLSATLFNYIGDGPLWNHFAIRHKEFCRKNWWTNIIFLNNYINVEEQCASFTWFLCVDMQLYFFSPLILLPMRKYKSFVYTVLPVLIILAMANSFAVSYIHELPAGSLNSRDLSLNVTVAMEYTRAHIRVGPWLVGSGLGYILHKLRNRKFYMTRLTATLCWMLAMAACLTTVYGIMYFYQDDYVFEKYLASLYTALHRTVWALFIAWIIFACETGYAGPVRKFLSWEFFQPLGKLTFCIYIVHSGYQYAMVARARGPSYYNWNIMFRDVLGELVVCIFLAFTGSLLFETPFRNLENIIIAGSKTTQGNDKGRTKQEPSTFEHNGTAEVKGISMSSTFTL